MGKKDNIEKVLEAYDDVFADIVNALIFNGEDVVKENELERGVERSIYVTDKRIRDQERDTSKYWKNTNIRIACIGIENQTSDEDGMPYRVIGYDGASYRDQIKREKIDDKWITIISRYPVVTLVLYFGYKHRWNQPKSIYEMLGDSLDDRLKPFVNDYKINLVEVAYLSDEELNRFHSDFKAVADYFVQMQRTGEYKGSTEEIKHVWEVMRLLQYLTNDDENVMKTITENTDDKEGTNMAGIFTTWLNQGKELGREEGKELGIEEGRELGREEGRITTYYELKKEEGYSDDQIIADAAKRYNLTEEQVKKYLEEVYKIV